MQKVILIFALVASITMHADAQNLMFGPDHINSLAVHVAQGTGSGSLLKLIDPVMWDISPMTSVMVQYSQPMKIFRLPARMNLNLVQNFGYRSNKGLSFFAAGISWDTAILQWRGFYVGLGLGPYMRDNYDRYVHSRLVFGEKVFIGKQITDSVRGEFYTLHFSNGDFTETNRGFNFAGIAMNYSF